MIKSLDNNLDIEVQTIVNNLYVPWAIAISDDDTIYFTERSGNIKMIKRGTNMPQLIFTFTEPFIAVGEGGALGLALDPEFSQNNYMYVMHTYMEEEQTYNRVVRLRLQGGEAFVDQVLIDRIPGGRTHNGGRIKIGPDQKLYITTGDAGDPMQAQDPNSLAGKILRINLDGTIPEDNPFSNSPVYSLGYRNPQGLAWNTNGLLYASEHGPIAHDEINIVLPGANYGWPLVQGDEESSDRTVTSPLIQSGEETWAPSGIAFADRGVWQGRLLAATLRGNRLIVMDLNEEGTQVINVGNWLQDTYGRLREVVQANDGSFYLATNNTDGRGSSRSGGDKIIHLTVRT